jgi:hypothetical protein
VFLSFNGQQTNPGWGGLGGGVKVHILVDIRLIRQQQPKQFRPVVQAFFNQMQIMSTKAKSDKTERSIGCHLGRADDTGVTITRYRVIFITQTPKIGEVRDVAVQ